MVRWPENTYLTKHHQKNLSFESVLEPEASWDGWSPGKSWLPGASPESDDWCYAIHFVGFNPISSPLWASPDAMSAKWTIQIMRIIGQLRLILMDMGHRLMTYTT
jgi:hypothetical protein